jgi:hypothetical protein
MNIFNIINSLFFSKKKIDLSLDSESQFSPYMINRWMSMYSDEMLVIINNTSNKYGGLFKNKDQQYNWYFNLFPKIRFKKIQYIKKNKKAKEEIKEDNLPLIAKNKEISVRELRLYKDFFDS